MARAGTDSPAQRLPPTHIIGGRVSQAAATRDLSPPRRAELARETSLDHDKRSDETVTPPSDHLPVPSFNWGYDPVSSNRGTGVSFGEFAQTVSDGTFTNEANDTDDSDNEFFSNLDNDLHGTTDPSNLCNISPTAPAVSRRTKTLVRPAVMRDTDGNFTPAAFDYFFRLSGMDPSAAARFGAAKTTPAVLPRPPYPIFRPSRPMRQADADILQTKIDELLAGGAIEKIRSSPYNCPVFLVDKKNPDGTVSKSRMVLDLTALNRDTPRYPIFISPTMEELLIRATHAPSGTNWMASFDLRSAYHQIPIAEESYDLVSFTGPDRQRYRYRCLTMGHVSSAAILAGVMDTILAGTEAFCEILADDLLVHAPTQELLEEHIMTVLRRLAEANLFLNYDKARGGSQRICWAGHVLEPNRIAPDPSKIAAILEWPVPTTAKSITRFMGFARWLSPFIPNFETMASPLNEAQRMAKTTVNLTEDQLRAFNDIKTAMASYPTLGTFDHRLAIEVHADCSDVAGASILRQKRADGSYFIVAYHHFCLTAAERRYAAREKEILAIVKCFKRYYSILRMAPDIILFSDHASIPVIIGKSVQASDRLVRSATFLSTFKVSWRFVPGVDNVAADALSRKDLNLSRRPPAAMKAPKTTGKPADAPPPGWEVPALAVVPRGGAAMAAAAVDEAVPAEDPPWVPPPVPIPADMVLDLKTELLHDEIYSVIIPSLLDPELANGLDKETRYRRRHLREHDGLLWFTGHGGVSRLVLPPGTVCQRVLGTFHDLTAHAHAADIIRVLNRAYYIHDAHRVVAAFNRSCVTCLRGKHSTSAKGFSDAQWSPISRWESISIDLATGLTLEHGVDTVLAIVDLLTGRVIYAPTRVTATAKDIVQLIWDFVIREHGFPKLIRCDSGTQFTSHEFARFCHENSISVNIAPTGQHAHHAERAIGTFRERIRQMTNGTLQGWVKVLSKVEFAVNSIPFGPENLSAFERDVGYSPFSPFTQPDLAARLGPEYAIYRSAADLIGLIDAFHANAERAAVVYDHGRVPGIFKVGDMACIDSKHYRPASTNPGGPAVKMRFVFSEPFQILEDMGFGNFRLAIPDGGRVNSVFHKSALKLATPVEDIDEDP